MNVHVRLAGPDDVPEILAFIRELAVYERLEHELALDAERLERHLFGPRPVAEALIGEIGDVPAGFALFFTTYSTFRTEACLHLEDLFVTSVQRGRGLGAALLRAVARVAADRGCARLQWHVLDWNEPAIEFYRRLGADVLRDWRVCRVEGRDALRRLAGRS